MDRGLTDVVARFTNNVGQALAEAADGTTIDAASLRENATIEAFNLSCAIVDSDGRQTDEELWALAATFGSAGLLPGATSPQDLRKSDLVAGKASWLNEPSELFTVLCDVDQRQGSGLSWIYLDEAMAVAYMVASLDRFPSHDELEAALRFQSMLLVHMGPRPTPESLAPDRHKPDSTTPASPIHGTPGRSSIDTADGHTPIQASDSQAATEDRSQEAEPTIEAEPLDDVLAELDELIGLDAVKEEVRLLSSLLRVQKLRADRGLPVVDNTKHLVFSGNPGTGKTTVARLLARIYHSLGVVNEGRLVEVDRGGLVAGFVGQTAEKVSKVFERADGGVLLIDEAYSLIRGSDKDFGREAIDAIVKQVEDRRDSMVVILAGYPKEMATLVSANPGFQSRFPKTIHFPDYDNEELLAILGLISDSGQYCLTRDAQEAAGVWFGAHQRGYGFGNGRLARNLFEAAVARHAGRLVDVAEPTDEQLTTLEAIDIASVPTPAEAAAVGTGGANSEAGDDPEPDPTS